MASKHLPSIISAIYIYGNEKKININQTNNTLSVYAGGTLSNNTYKWFKDGALISTILQIQLIHQQQAAAYTVQVTNSIATELTLISDTVTFKLNGIQQKILLHCKQVIKIIFPFIRTLQKQLPLLYLIQKETVL